MEDKITVNTIKLEDNLKYMIIGSVNLDDNKYFIFSQIDNTDNYQVRKVVDEDRLSKLDDRFELREVINLFIDKMKGLRNEE